MDKLIRDLTDDEAKAIKAHADAAGMTERDWLAAIIRAAIAQPVRRVRYGFRCYDENGASAVLKRYSDHENGVVCVARNMTEDQSLAVHQSRDLMRRNEIGDREQAIGLLSRFFSNVFEIPV